MKRSFRSHLTGMVREAQAACRQSALTGIPIDEVTSLRAERMRQRLPTRRDLLRGTGSILAASVIAGQPRIAKAGGGLRTVIVGAGLAGLRCAHSLWINRGLIADVYEWDNHAGGRVETLRNFFADGQITEQHGEFISSEHVSTLGLAAYFGLKLSLANSEPVSGLNNVYWFNGGYYTQAELNADWQKFGYALFTNAVHQAPWPTSFNKYKQTAYEWDHMSVVDWINKYVPGAMNAPFGRLCYQDVISEYGGPPEQQSALNLVNLLGYYSSTNGRGLQPANQPVLASTDEKYQITGGNDQLITGMLGDLPSGVVKTGQKLMAVKLTSGGSYTCTFQSGSSTYDVPADHVVLAIPFTTLRKVDLSKAGLSKVKMDAIQNMSMGTNVKIQLQFNSRVWYNEGFNANAIADNGAAATWEVTNNQAGNAGILDDLPGGTQGAQLPAKYGITADESVPPAALVRDTLAAMEPIFPGVTAAYNGKAYCACGLLDPHVLGSYSYYSMGQYTGFSGIEPAQEGNIHFAGEQTSIDFQGYMEGAVASGERAANEIGPPYGPA